MTSGAALCRVPRAVVVDAALSSHSARPTCCAAMASLHILAFDHDGRPIQFDTWLDDLLLYLLGDSRDSVSLFNHTSGAAPAPPTTADTATHSQWLTRDVAARLAIRNHLPLAECAHFGKHMTTQALYDAVVARYSSPATTALGRLILPYLFLELSAFATIEDLVSRLRTSNTRYRAALPAEFLVRNPPPIFITLYFIVTRLPDSLRSVRDHFLALDPTALTVDLPEQHLLAAESSVVTIGAARGTPRTPFIEGCSLSPLAPSYTSAATVDILGAEDVGAASTSVKRRNSKGKGGRVVVVAAGVVVGAAVEVVEAVDVVAVVGVVVEVGALVAAVVAAVGVAVVAAARVVAVGLELQSVDVLAVARCSSSSVGVRPRRPSSFTCGKPHTQHRCFSRLDDAWRTEFGDKAERPRWAELHRSGVAIFDLDYDAIQAAMYVLSVSAEGDCYLCVPSDPGIKAAALGASESALPGTAPGEALHTFTLDSSASRCFFCDSTTLTPLSAPVPVRLADPSGGPVLARSSTILPCLAVPSGLLSGLHLPSFSTNLVSTAALQDAMVTTTTPGGQRVSIYTCTRTSLHLATFTCRPGLSYGTTALVTPSLPRLRGMHSRLLVSGLPRSLPPLPPSPAPPFLACVEGRQRATPHSSFPPTTAPLHTLHMDVWGPTCVSGQGRERKFLLVVDDYTRYTTVFPLRSKGQVVDVSIPWIRAVRLQLRERFCQDLLVLRLHSNRGAQPLASCLLARDLTDTALDEGGLRCIGVPVGSLLPSLSLPLCPSPTPALFHAPGPPPVDPLPPQGPAPLGVSQVDPFLGTVPFVPASPLPTPSPYSEQTGGLTERREPASCPASPVRTCRCVPRLRPPPVPGTHAMALRPSSVPLFVRLPPPRESSLPALPDLESDRARAASPTVSRLLATVVIDPSFESTTASALVAELVDFAAACLLDYATALVAESESASPPSVGDPDAPDIPTPRSYAEAITGPYSSQWQAAMDAEMAFWKSTGTYVDAVPPSRANIVDDMWIFMVKQLPGSLRAFKARYVARGFS
ncbi:unnamed protein product [Closterium sp. NIES-54]